MDEVDGATSFTMLTDLDNEAIGALEALKRRMGYFGYLRRGIIPGGLERLETKLEGTIAYLANSKEQLVVNKISDYPTLPHLWLMNPFSHSWSTWLAAILFPIGMTLWLMALRERKELRREINLIHNIDQQLLAIIGTQPVDTDYQQDNSIIFNSEKDND